MAALALAFIFVSIIGLVPFLVSNASSLVPTPDNIAAFELRFTDAQGELKQSFDRSEHVYIRMLAKNYNSTLDPNAVTIIQVTGLEDNIVYHLYWEESLYPFNQEVQRSFEIPPLVESNEYYVTFYFWSNLDNPEVVGDSTGSRLDFIS